MRPIYLSMSEINEHGYGYLRTALSLPDYFGDNLDALYDCISEMNGRRIEFSADAEPTEFTRRVMMVTELALEE